MMRIFLFLATNLAVIAVASIIFSVLGVQGVLATNGVDLDLGSLAIFCLVYGMLFSMISLLMSKWLAKRSMGVRIIERPQNPDEAWLFETVKDLSEKAGIKMPEVGVFPAEESNAFATGWNKNDALVALSEGLLYRFNKDEVRAVIGHEIGHVANGDMVTLALIQGVVNAFVMFFARIIGHTVDRVVFKTEEGHGIGYFIVTIVAEIVLGIAASMIVAWFSRQREYRADEAGAHLSDKQSMINALERLRRESEIPTQMDERFTAFGIRGGALGALGRLMATHPPLEDRIAVLQKRAA